MVTETASTMQVPRVQAYGVGDLNRLKPFVFEGQVDTEIKNLGTPKPLSELHKCSGALRDQRFLYELGLSQKADKPVDAPEEVQRAGIVVYDLFQERGRGAATNDACDYDNGDKSLRKEGYASVRWVVHPANIAGGIELGGQSEVYHILLPIAQDNDSRWVLMTVDGMYRPDTGSPFALGSKKQAVQSMVKRGFPQELAENEASRFYGRNEGQGIAAVSRWSYLHVGPFVVSADVDPRGGSPVLGSFLASRSPSGARPASENGIRTLIESEYQRLQRRDAILRGFEEQLSGLQKQE